MNKGLFLVFAIYLLVVNMGGIGYFLNQPVFYKIAIINAGVILVFSTFYAMFSGKSTEKTSEQVIEKEENADSSEGEGENNEESHSDSVCDSEKVSLTSSSKQSENAEKNPSKEEKNTHEEPQKKNAYAETMLKSNMRQKTQPVKRKKTIRYGQWIVFIVSLIIAGAVFFISYEFLSQWSYIIATFMGFLAYVILGKLLDVSGFHKVRGLFSAWIYYLILLFFLLYSGVMMFGEEQLIKKIDQYVPISRLKEFDLLQYLSFSQDESLLTGSKFEKNHFQLGDGIILQYQPIEIISTGDEISGVMNNENSENSNLQTLENLLTPENTGTENSIPEPTIGITTQKYTFLEAIKHLLTENKVNLSQKKTTQFTGLPQNSADYPYFQTALEKGLIGKNTLPNDLIPCDNYIVMKGLIEGRNMGTYNKNNILSVYREKAKSLNKLNGCEKGQIVTNKTL